MLKEYLSNQSSSSIHWNSAIPGVRTCRFALHSTERNTLSPVPVCGEPLHFEALFCLSGRLLIEPLQRSPCAVEAPGILLLSDISRLRACMCSEDLGGVFVSVDAASAKKSLHAICSALGIELNTNGVREKMASSGGYLLLSDTPWTQAFFKTMKCLPHGAQERYCVFKAVELLYLLCSEVPASDGSERESGSIPHRLIRVSDYMQEHLSEKITVQSLCNKFLVSPTYLKAAFRRAYGMPIHTWLIRQRITRARELICTTQMPVQEIAHAVGYESISQFNTSFRKYYGMSPGQYRKMSETVALRPFRQ